MSRLKISCFFFVSVEMHFCAEPDKLTTLVSHPNFIASRILNSKCVIVYMRSKRCFFQRPYIVGVTVLDLSKLQMYSDYYFLLVPALNGQVSLMMTDTGIVDISIVTSSPNCRDAFCFLFLFFQILFCCMLNPTTSMRFLNSTKMRLTFPI